MGCSTTSTTSFKAIILGPPGVGKGTQCDLLQTIIPFEHISTGDLIRDQIKKQTDIGKQIQAISEAGGLVPDEIVDKLLQDHLAKIPPSRPWMIDGFPRTEKQAMYLKDANLGITHVIELQGDEEEIIQRLSGRLFDPETGHTYHKTLNPPPTEVAGRCITRKDDQPEVIRKRFETFRESAQSIRRIFGAKVKEIDTKGRTIDEIQKSVREALQ